MLMPFQLPSAAFMANGGATFVPMTNSCWDDTEEFAVSVICARLELVKISTAAANAGTMGYLHIITRRKGSLFLGTEEAVRPLADAQML
jgi:hypothetical protein